MKLTRKQLNEITRKLPHPSRVINGDIPPMYVTTIMESMLAIFDSELPNGHITVKRLIWDFDFQEMDWVLNNLEL